MYEPSPIGKVCIYGSFVATPFILAGFTAWIVGNERALNICSIVFILVAAATSMTALIVWVRTPEVISVAPLLEPEGSPEAVTMVDEPPVTAEEVLAALKLTDAEFMADLTANVPAFVHHPGEPA